jgi:hypothetical protein
MKTKICNKCNIRKLLNKFYFGKRDNYYFRACKSCIIKVQLKRYYKKSKEIIKHQLKYYYKNKSKILKREKCYFKNNKKRLQINRTKYMKEKRRTDIDFKLRCNLRSRIYCVLKGINKSKSTIKLLGCSIEKLKSHLESKFKPGMNWKNYGFYGWHIDHIKPCCSFDLSKDSEQLKCFNYKNLQPLWALENKHKSGS